MEKLAFHAMGCQMLAAMEAPQIEAERRLGTVPEWFESWEACLSRFRPESELSQLNRRPGWPAPVSSVLWQVFQAANWAYQWSGGLVSPTILRALQAAGYDRSFELLDRAQGVVEAPAQAAFDQAPISRAASAGAAQVASDAGALSIIEAPTLAAFDQALASRGAQAVNGGQPAPALERVKVDYERRTLELPEGVALDFGGVAKGWAASQAARRLGRYRPALVDAGGDIAVSGRLPGGAPWPVGVADPLHPGQDLALLGLGRSGVATSGRDYRRWQQQGEMRHHLIDPRTGRPAETDVLSATVIAADLVMAETAAKVVLILGSREGMDWLERRPGLAGLIVREDGTWTGSRTLEKHLWQ